MSLTFKKNKQGLYKIKDETSNEFVTDWITEDEVKKILIEREHRKFIHRTIEIEMEFPNGYYVNDKYQEKEELHQVGKIFVIKNWGKQKIKETFNDISKRLKLNL